jgi:hypothetical protein
VATIPTCDLCAKVFDWGKYRSAKGTVKIDILLDHDGQGPTKIARMLPWLSLGMKPLGTSWKR